jgi:hypothetical protein
MRDKVEKALRRHGAIKQDETLLWEKYGVGFRLIVIGQLKGKTLQQYALAFDSIPTGSVSDQVNGVVGRFIQCRPK